MPEQNQQTKTQKLSTQTVILLIILTTIFMSLFRVYIGGSLGFKVVGKDYFSFKDTFVNLSDLDGMPREAFASKHPAVKKQLERMKIIRTDEQVAEEFSRKSMEEIQKMWGY
ncbi:MAG: hypothetical protein KAI70_07940 [Candidatus Omnitrophica bacterium]|nr:hypothetical protein [Candidatus Omnitrophota bacterium]